MLTPFSIKVDALEEFEDLPNMTVTEVGTVQYSTVQYSTGGGDMLYVVITKLGHGGTSEAAAVNREDESGNL